jgi:hypothetical protein
MTNPKIALWQAVFRTIDESQYSLSAVRAIVKPNGYIEGAVATGAEPNYTMSFLTKEVPIVFLIPVAWHVGVIAGYL